MSDDATMRARLQTVAAYRELRRSVARGGRENVVFALVMLGLAYFMYSAGGPNQDVAVLYAVLACGELLVGLFKWLAPSAEGLILDALVLLVFAGVNFWLQYAQFRRGWQPNPVIV